MSQSTNSLAAAGASDLSAVFFGEIQTAAEAVALELNMPNMIALDEGSLGDFPWFWQLGTNFNALTFSWLNKLFDYNSSDNYLETEGEAFTTAYFNVLMATAYYLDAADSSAYNNANNANITILNTLITNWATTQGAIPSTFSTMAEQTNYVMAQVLSWGTPGLTLGELRTSLNPMSLLPNIPLGGDLIVSNLMEYLGATSSVANIQAAVSSANAQLAQTRAGLQPTPETISEGWMWVQDGQGNLSLEPRIKIQEPTADIQNNLFPTDGNGKTFSVSYVVSQDDVDTVNVTSQSGSASSPLGNFFLFGSASNSTFLNIFSADSAQQSVEISLTFNGVTTVTPSAYAYSISSGKGWWNPQPIQNAAANNAGQSMPNPPPTSGYWFSPNPLYNFAVNGNFGFLSRLMISQQPIINLTYNTSNYSEYQKTFQDTDKWSVSFLGIGLGGGSDSYYESQTSFDSTAKQVTVTMSPVGNTAPIPPANQLAYVIGAEVNWVGAS